MVVAVISNLVGKKLLHPRELLRLHIANRGKHGILHRALEQLRGVDASLDKEAVRIVSMSPKWTPGKQRERPVKVVYNFPVVFQLR